jgi:NAD dependent epimerase/dehydratase family enzyme
VPEAVLRVILGGEMASEFLLASQRALPQRLLSAGFTFADRSLPDALEAALRDR